MAMVSQTHPPKLCNYRISCHHALAPEEKHIFSYEYMAFGEGLEIKDVHPFQDLFAHSIAWAVGD